MLDFYRYLFIKSSPKTYLLSKESLVAKVFALFNQSGGVGKTTMTMNLGHLISQRQKDDESLYRVLLIDMDPQGSLTSFNGFAPHELDETMYNALLSSQAPKVHTQHGYDIAPANLQLSFADMQLLSEMRREERLKNCLRTMQSSYDVILIDCPPGLTLLSYMSLVASSYLLIPIQTEFKSAQATLNLLETTSRVLETGNPDLKVAGVMPTMYDKRINEANDALELIRATFTDLKQYETGPFAGTMIYNPIPRRTDVAKASSKRLPLAIFSPKQDALRPMNEIVDHLLSLS